MLYQLSYATTCNDWDEIRTRASEETSALNWRLRPLGHPISLCLHQLEQKTNQHSTETFFYSSYCKLTQRAFVAQLAARGSHNPKVAGSIPVESKHFFPVSLGGQDTRLSPERPGFNSRTGNFFNLNFKRLSRLYTSTQHIPIVSTGVYTVTSGSMARLTWFFLLACAVESLSCSRV